MTAAKRGGKRCGYIRVSSIDQNTVRQLDGVQLDRVFTDKASGKDTNRPQLRAALDYLRDGDVLVVHSMDRLARNITDLLHTVESLNGRGVVVEFVKESLIFTGDDSAMSKLMLTIMGGVAEFERAMIRERQLEGIAKAKQAGKYTGRKSTMTETQVKAIRDRVAAGENKSALAREFGVTRQTVYNVLTASAQLSTAVRGR
jgi:DNA invertase Pin-like site-specific DNA recombinase